MTKKILGALSMCLLMAVGAQAVTITWTGTGTAGNWNVATNWITGYVPGTTTSDIAVWNGALTGNVTTAVNPAKGVTLTMRNGGVLYVSANMALANMNIGTTGDGAATLNQTAGTINSGTLTMGLLGGAKLAGYTLSGSGALSLLNDMLLQDHSLFTVSGSGASVQVGKSIGDDLIMTGTGELKFVLGATGVNAINVFNAFDVAATSLLVIDGSAYTGGNANITLVNAASMTGSFVSGKYTVTGLGAENTGWKLTQGTNGDVVLNVIPEPATIGMLGLGAIITLLIRRRFLA